MAIYLGSGSLTYLLSLIKQKLDLKVDKDGNKTLSTNDYTNDDKNKLSNIPANAQANIIETIKVNNSQLTPNNKTINITIPTSTKDISNDSGYITSSTLVDYATEEYVDNAVAGVSGGGSVDLSSYLTKTEATNTYATKSDTYTIAESEQAAEDAVKIKSIKVYDTTLSPSNKIVTIPRAAQNTYGCVKTTSTVASSSGYTAVPIVNGVPYYKNTTYSAATTSANGLMTASDKSKLDGIDSGAEVNTIETIKVNNTAQTITSKAVNITVPTVTSALTNDSGFITQSNLNNYVSSNELSSTLDDYATTTVTDALGTRITALEQNSGSSSGSSTGTANTCDITFDTINIAETNQLVISSPSSFAEILFYWNAGYKLTISGEVWFDKDDSNNGNKLIINHAPMSPMSQYVESNNPVVLWFYFGGVFHSPTGMPTNWGIKIEMQSQDIESSFAEIQLETVTY